MTTFGVMDRWSYGSSELWTVGVEPDPDIGPSNGRHRTFQKYMLWTPLVKVLSLESFHQSYSNLFIACLAKIAALDLFRYMYC